MEVRTGGAFVKAWVNGVQFEEEAKQQAINCASLPFIHNHIALMPDVHAGCGATIGSVIPTIGAIIPAVVGVDIGCGMMAIQTTLKAEDLPDNLKSIRSAIELAVPHGRTDNGGPNDKGAWNKPPTDILSLWIDLSGDKRFKEVCEKHPGITKRVNHVSHLGTLGTGNHFIEVCLDEDNNVWIMLHSGSRGIGNRIGSYFIKKAKEDMKKWFINLPDKDLSYLIEGSENFNDYIKAVGWAQDYARLNREIMMLRVIKAIQKELGKVIESLAEAVNCHHNYVQKENHFGANVWLTRKGAVSAREGQLGIIPGSMGAKSYIVKGKGDKWSFNSCSHGAGRAMSRTKARNTFTEDDHIKATEGVECRKDIDVIDETPAAYKDIDAVMNAQRDLVDIVHTLKQVVCIKG